MKKVLLNHHLLDVSRENFLNIQMGFWQATMYVILCLAFPGFSKLLPCRYIYQDIPFAVPGYPHPTKSGVNQAGDRKCLSVTYISTAYGGLRLGQGPTAGFWVLSYVCWIYHRVS